MAGLTLGSSLQKTAHRAVLLLYKEIRVHIECPVVWCMVGFLELDRSHV